MKKQVLFYGQNWNAAEWQELGFGNYKDAEYWKEYSCGVVCLKMAVDTILMDKSRPISPNISEYIKAGVRIGAYSERNGWIHAGLVRLAKHFGVSATAQSHIDVNQLKEMLLQNTLPIISIKWAFKNIRSLKERVFFWKKYGGHMALLVGFEDEHSLKGFYVHHTSDSDEYNWQYRFIPIDTFKQAFTGRCIAVKI